MGFTITTKQYRDREGAAWRRLTPSHAALPPPEFVGYARRSLTVAVLTGGQNRDALPQYYLPRASTGSSPIASRAARKNWLGNNPEVPGKVSISLPDGSRR